MPNDSNLYAVVNERGDLVLPTAVQAKLGLQPGDQLALQSDGLLVHLQPPLTRLARVYIEPTNICNLDCTTCMRNIWQEPAGMMSLDTFNRIMDGLRQFSPAPSIFFGGYGEPLAHPEILGMVARAREVSPEVELITNGILLTEDIIRRLVELEVKTLWVSIDGASPESYSDVRLGATLPIVLENLQRLQTIKQHHYRHWPQLGIAFVAMAQNLADLPEVVRMGLQLGAVRFSISNVLAHTPELRQQILYEKAHYDFRNHMPRRVPVVDLPRMDATPEYMHVLHELMNTATLLNLNNCSSAASVNRCPFVEKGSTSIRWDGEISPCLPLLHTHSSYLDDHQRVSHAASFGNINDKDLRQLWLDPEYLALRNRLQTFDFSPCTYCNSCELSDNNLEDCFGNTLPTCGGCLWAQGLIRCP